MDDLNTSLILQEAAVIKRYAVSFEEDRAKSMSMPSYKLLPKLSIDGNQWCALFGEDLQNGVAGFGDSPEEAYCNFDKNWTAKLNKP